MTSARLLLCLAAALALSTPAVRAAVNTPVAPTAAPAAPGRVAGVVTDSTSGETLIGATVRVEGTSIGSATDIDGRFSISGVPSGPQTLIVSYIGYDDKTVEVLVPDGGSVTVDVALAYSVSDALGEVTVTAQTQGQLAAINQQLNSNTIVNIVSSDRIRELPDNNAAESIGRLPGVALQRSSGEANKVVIRGLSPKFNTVLVNGVRVPSTDANDRSVDLTTISPESLAGIEVYKALPANFEADAIGGTVNLRLRTAPTGLHGYASAQGGYNQLENSYGNYRFYGNVSNRFLGDALGLIVGGNLERVDRSSSVLNGGFGLVNVSDSTSTVGVNNLRLDQNSETRRRTGGSLVADYRYGTGNVTFNTFLSRRASDGSYRQDLFDVGGNSQAYVIGEGRNTIDLATGALNVLQRVGSLQIDATGSFARSLNRSPNDRSWDFIEGGAFNPGITRSGAGQTPFDSLQTFAKNDIDGTYLNHVNIADLRTRESETTGRVELTYPVSFGSLVSGSVKVGGMARNRGRTFNRTQQSDNLVFGGSRFYRDEIVAQMPGLFPDPNAAATALPFQTFIDPSRPSAPFLGSYTFGPTAQLGLLNQLSDIIADTLRFDALNSFASDYNGTERYKAAFAMAELKLGEYVTFTPGLRYERMNTEYTGYFIKDRGGFPTAADFADSDTTVSRENDYFFPQMLLTVRPTDWLDVRAGRTRTLTRPDYNQITPRRFVPQSGNYIQQSNPFITPALSTNYDISASLHEAHVGLFSAGYFSKAVDGFITVADTYLIDDCNIQGFTPPCSAQIPGAQPNANIQLPINNPFTSHVKGVELDLQTSLWYLPSVLRGVVLNANYTRITSSTRYSYTTLNQEYVFEPEFMLIVTQVDSSRAGRLYDQPSDLLNLAIGYDLGGFSSRLSFQYTTSKLRGLNPTRPNGDSFTSDLLRVDFSGRQRLPGGLEVYVNLNNLTSALDRAYYSTGTLYPTYAQDYGFTGDLGVRYRF